MAMEPSDCTAVAPGSAMCKHTGSGTTGTSRGAASDAERAGEGTVAEDDCRKCMGQPSQQEQHEAINTFVLVN